MMLMRPRLPTRGDGTASISHVFVSSVAIVADFTGWSCVFCFICNRDTN